MGFIVIICLSAVCSWIIKWKITKTLGDPIEIAAIYFIIAFSGFFILSFFSFFWSLGWLIGASYPIWLSPFIHVIKKLLSSKL